MYPKDVVVSTDQTAGYIASVYSFPTMNGTSRTSVDVTYIKNGEEVNQRIAHLIQALLLNLLNVLLFICIFWKKHICKIHGIILAH